MPTSPSVLIARAPRQLVRVRSQQWLVPRTHGSRHPMPDLASSAFDRALVMLPGASHDWVDGELTAALEVEQLAQPFARVRDGSLPVPVVLNVPQDLAR